jgi:heme-degrading monooxygenase HmoA
MSVVVIGKMTVNPDNLEKLFTERAEVFTSVAAEAKQRGVIHHAFLRGEGDTALILDEWDTAEHFFEFFGSQAQIPELMAEAGVAGPPEFTVYEVMDSPDRI